MLLDLLETDKDLREFTTLVVKDALSQAGINMEKEISQREAYRRFGEMRVKVWVTKGLVNPIQSGVGKNSKIYYSVSELEYAEFIERQMNRKKIRF